MAIVIVGTSHTRVQLKQDHTEHSVKPLELHAYAKVRNDTRKRTFRTRCPRPNDPSSRYIAALLSNTSTESHDRTTAYLIGS